MSDSIEVNQAVEAAVFLVLKKAADRSRSKEWCDIFGLNGEKGRLVSKIVKMTNKDVPLCKREHKRATLAVLDGLESIGRLKRSKSGRWIFKTEILQKAHMLEARKGRKMKLRGTNNPYINSPARKQQPIPAAA